MSRVLVHTTDTEVAPWVNAHAVTGAQATNLFTSAAHKMKAGYGVVFSGLTGGAGIVAGQTYYVLATGLTASAFQVSATPGGAPLDFTTDLTAGTFTTTVLPQHKANGIGGYVIMAGSISTLSGVHPSVANGTDAQKLSTPPQAIYDYEAKLKPLVDAAHANGQLFALRISLTNYGNGSTPLAPWFDGGSAIGGGPKWDFDFVDRTVPNNVEYRRSICTVWRMYFEMFRRIGVDDFMYDGEEYASGHRAYLDALRPGSDQFLGQDGNWSWRTDYQLDDADAVPARNVVGSAATNVFTTTLPTGFTEGAVVRFNSPVGGSGLTAGTAYTVLQTNLTATTFMVSLTRGGTPLDITSDLTGGNVERTQKWPHLTIPANTRTDAETRAQARIRGRQFGQAIEAGYPGAKLSVYYWRGLQGNQWEWEFKHYNGNQPLPPGGWEAVSNPYHDRGVQDDFYAGVLEGTTGTFRVCDAGFFKGSPYRTDERAGMLDARTKMRQSVLALVPDAIKQSVYDRLVIQPWPWMDASALGEVGAEYKGDARVVEQGDNVAANAEAAPGQPAWIHLYAHQFDNPAQHWTDPGIYTATKRMAAFTGTVAIPPFSPPTSLSYPIRVEGSDGQAITVTMTVS